MIISCYQFHCNFVGPLWCFNFIPSFSPLYVVGDGSEKHPCPDALNSRDPAGLFQGEALMPARCQRQVPAIYSSKQQADSIVTARWTPTGASAQSFTPCSLGTNTFPPLCTSSPSSVENQFPSYDPSPLEICRSMFFFSETLIDSDTLLKCITFPCLLK